MYPVPNEKFGYFRPFSSTRKEMFVTMIKRNFVINGTLKFVTFEEGDTLADLLRRLGLRSVKIGCNAGQCGSCSVLVDGDVVRSCIKKLRI